MGDVNAKAGFNNTGYEVCMGIYMGSQGVGKINDNGDRFHKMYVSLVVPFSNTRQSTR